MNFRVLLDRFVLSCLRGTSSTPGIFPCSEVPVIQPCLLGGIYVIDKTERGCVQAHDHARAGSAGPAARARKSSPCHTNVVETNSGFKGCSERRFACEPPRQPLGLYPSSAHAENVPCCQRRVTAKLYGLFGIVIRILPAYFRPASFPVAFKILRVRQLVKSEQGNPYTRFRAWATHHIKKKQKNFHDSGSPVKPTCIVQFLFSQL